MAPSPFIRGLPKVQLHCHLEGTVRATTFRELAAKHAVDIGVRGTAPIEQTYDFATFTEFLALFMAVCNTLRAPDDYARMARDYVEDAAGQGVAYAELHISPSVWAHFIPGLDVRACIAALREGLDDAGKRHGVDVALLYDVTRNLGAEKARASVDQAAELQQYGVIGIGLGGDEARFPAPLFLDVFEAARAAGLHTVAHAGEAAGAQSVRDAIDVLGAERIGHGVRAREDDALIDELARSKILLELCPTSNRLTGAVRPGEEHPIAEFDRRGVRCMIDDDDPALFGTTLCDEYATVAELTGEDALPRFVRNAIEASFATSASKATLLARLDAYCAETGSPRRSI